MNKIIERLAEKAQMLGFKVYLAKHGDYGFITDETRVLTFSLLLGNICLRGSCEPHGTWVVNDNVDFLDINDLTRHQLHNYLYASAPSRISEKGLVKYTTAIERLDNGGETSGYTLYNQGGNNAWQSDQNQ